MLRQSYCDLSQLMLVRTRSRWECSSPSYSSMRTMLRMCRLCILTSISDIPSDSALRGEPIPERTLLANAKTVYVAELVYYIIQSSLKFSILAFYWRLFKTTMRVPIYFVACFIMVWFFATVNCALNLFFDLELYRHHYRYFIIAALSITQNLTLSVSADPSRSFPMYPCCLSLDARLAKLSEMRRPSAIFLRHLYPQHPSRSPPTYIAHALRLETENYLDTKGRRYGIFLSWWLVSHSSTTIVEATPRHSLTEFVQ